MKREKYLVYLKEQADLEAKRLKKERDAQKLVHDFLKENRKFNRWMTKFILAVRYEGQNQIDKRLREEAERKRLIEQAELERQILVEQERIRKEREEEEERLRVEEEARL